MINIQETVRTRVAPSPTGTPHIGTAYVALFNQAFARRHGGRFVLRIEDTDRTRSSPKWEVALIEALRWLGVAWDEGPDIGGDFGPYRQSERLSIYRDHVDRLVKEGGAYPCFCSSERLEELRKRQAQEKASIQGYDGLCASISSAEAKRRIDAGETYVIRMRVPREGECVFRDRFRGEIRIPWNQIDHQVLMKSDGYPTYHLANVVDDHLMRITHVIRGEEWISSAPKHVLLYSLFGWQPPEFAHLPLLRNPDKTKLSKRRNPTSILYYRDAGYLPEALSNYLCLMGYSRSDGREIFSLREMFEDFDIDRISLGGPIFDLNKLASFNAQYIRHLSPDELVLRLAQWRLNCDYWRRIVPLAQPRLQRLGDFVPMAAFLFADRLNYRVEDLLGPTKDQIRVAELLKIGQWELEKVENWEKDRLREVFEKIAVIEQIKLKSALTPFFVAICGSAVSLPLFESMEILGRDLSLRRLIYAQELLLAAGHGVQGRELKELQSRYERAYGAQE